MYVMMMIHTSVNKTFVFSCTTVAAERMEGEVKRKNNLV